MNFNPGDIVNFSVMVAPILFLLAVGLMLMLMDVLKAHSSMPLIAGLGLIGAGVLAVLPEKISSMQAFYGMIEVGNIAPLNIVFLCLSGVFTIFFLPDYLKRQDKPIYEVYTLLIFAIIGMIMMANASDLLITFIGLETFSIALYVFAALFKKEETSNEAGLKYFLLGAFASAFLLLGISLLYGLTGYTNLNDIAANASKLTDNPALFFTSIGLFIIGFLFKVSAFPFHNWTPDVYSGTPTPLAGFMATGSKMAAFIALGTVLIKLNFTQYDKLVNVLALAAILSMIYGNVVAVRQKNLKRMLAYSSIAHTGYVLLGLCAGKAGFVAVIFYMFIYTIMNIGAFGLVGIAERTLADTDMDKWKGLGIKAPYFAAAMSLFLFSMAGIPPFAGFMSKYQVFIAAIGSGQILLAVIGILTSVIAAFYYIYLIVIMYFGKNESPEVSPRFDWTTGLGVGLLAVLILLLGIFPSLVLQPLLQYMSGSISAVAAAF